MSDRPKSSNPVTSPNIVVFPGVFQRPETKPAVSSPIQLELALSGARVLFTVATEKLNGAAFVSMLMSTSPRLILDLRYSPHFEFGGVSSTTVKGVIGQLGIVYFRHSLPLHQFASGILRFAPEKLFPQIVREAFRFAQSVRSKWNNQFVRKHLRHAVYGNVASTKTKLDGKRKSTLSTSRHVRNRFEGPLLVLVQNPSEINLVGNYILSALAKLDSAKWECVSFE